MLITAIQRKHYALLGELLIQNEPETAKKLISAYLPDEPPKETDFKKISDYFSEFRRLNNITSLNVSDRRIFIAVTLHIYNPEVYFQPSNKILLKHGFVRCLSNVLGQKEPNVSKMIREVILWERSYEDFAQEVSKMIEKLTNDTE